MRANRLLITLAEAIKIILKTMAKTKPIPCNISIQTSKIPLRTKKRALSKCPRSFSKILGESSSCSGVCRAGFDWTTAGLSPRGLYTVRTFFFLASAESSEVKEVALSTDLLRESVFAELGLRNLIDIVFYLFLRKLASDFMMN